MAHTKATGGAKRNVDVAGKRLGLKKFAGEYVRAGNIVLRQRGTVFHPGLNTDIGRDHTIFATAEGIVSFRQMTGRKRWSKAVDVLPVTTPVSKKEVVEVKEEVAEEAPVKKEAAKPKATKPTSAKKTTKSAKSAK